MVERENAVQAEGVEERRAESTPKTEKHDSTKGSFMRLRHQADVRALVWALLLFPAVPGSHVTYLHSTGYSPAYFNLLI